MDKRWIGFLSAALLFLNGHGALASEPVTIGAILAAPETYYFHEATLQGTAREVKLLGVVLGARCGRLYDAYTFILEDGTGSIEVEVGGTCRGPGIVVVVDDGDKVIVEAHINRYGAGSGPYTVKASAKDVRRVGK
jgi:hypothetical protein